jgi:hypothetical protein
MLRMHGLALVVHSWLCWVVLITAVVVVVRAVTGWRSGRPWTLADDRAGLWFSIALDVQVLLGLLLYFALSPITREAMGDFVAAMSNSALRYWAVEHVFGIAVSLVLAHVGRSRVRRIGPDARRHKVAAIFFGLSLLAMVVSIPWPGMPQGRPLLRW